MPRPKKVQMVGDAGEDTQGAMLDTGAAPETEKPKRTRAPRASKAKKHITVEDLIKPDTGSVQVGAMMLRLASGARFGREYALNVQEATKLSYHANRLGTRAALPLIERILSTVNLKLDENGQDVLSIAQVSGAYALRLAQPVIERLFTMMAYMDAPETETPPDSIYREPSEAEMQAKREWAEKQPKPAPQDAEDATRKANEAALMAWVDTASYGASEGE